MAGFLKSVRKAVRAAQKASTANATKPYTTKGRRATVVRIAYRELHQPAPNWDPNDLNHGYAYTWSLPTPPALGHRVILEHARGQKGVVVGFGTTYNGALLPVHRLATMAEIDAAYAKAAADENAWLAMARRAAGLPSSTRRSRVPNGYPAIAPVDGRAGVQSANEYGRMWWRVYKTAQAQAWPANEVQRVESIARRWYAVRDKGGN